MGLTSFTQIAEYAAGLYPKPVVAVAEAQDANTLEAVVRAARDGILRPLLIGDKARITALLDTFGAGGGQYEILPSGGAQDSLRLAVERIRAGGATAIMKGHLESGDFMRAVVSRDNGLVYGRRLSVIGFYELPGYHKLLAVSDFGLNTHPDLEGKKDIITNAVALLHALGIAAPKVAVLASVERLNPKMPDTVDAHALKQMNLSGEIPGCIIEGPISFDLATSAQAARIKGYVSPVAGDADLLIVPDVTAGNLLVKCLTGFAHARTAGTVLGARIPVIFTSRSAEMLDKYYSIALAACAAHAKGGR